MLWCPQPAPQRTQRPAATQSETGGFTGQAVWSMPWRDEPMYQGWLKFMHFDKSPRMIGLRGIGEAAAALPAAAETAIAWALKELSVPFYLTDDYLFAALLSIGGWAGWARYLRWQ
ncbi:putative inorganic carbon transporter subunit DabA, partial [Acidithiobacillus ferrooxidans]|uniref:putative inorganic carbon transporter subunit DabA n=1 Tax=Acidithiobacillus ferrooxidans TaxID=920 RepID=UPI001D00202A